MSINPGVTSKPFASTTCAAPAVSIFLSIFAILPSAMATSITALILFFGSITWPPLITIEYFCEYAETATPSKAAVNRKENLNILYGCVFKFFCNPCSHNFFLAGFKHKYGDVDGAVVFTHHFY